MELGSSIKVPISLGQALGKGDARRRLAVATKKLLNVFPRSAYGSKLLLWFDLRQNWGVRTIGKVFLSCLVYHLKGRRMLIPLRPTSSLAGGQP